MNQYFLNFIFRNSGLTYKQTRKKMSRKIYFYLLVGLLLQALCHKSESAKPTKVKSPAKSNLKKPSQIIFKLLSGKKPNKNDEMYQQFLKDRMSRYGNSKAYSLLTRIGKRRDTFKM